MAAVGARAQLARASEIATVLFASEFHRLVEALGLSPCVSPRCRFVCSFRPKQQCPHHVDMTLPLPDRIREVLERLGPTFVKAGQMLALRPDYVPLVRSGYAALPAAPAPVELACHTRAPTVSSLVPGASASWLFEPPRAVSGRYLPLWGIRRVTDAGRRAWLEASRTRRAREREKSAMKRFETNITPIERAGRIAIGAGAAILGGLLIASGGGVLAVALEVLFVLAGLDLVVTGALGHCPLYRKLGHVPPSLRRPA